MRVATWILIGLTAAAVGNIIPADAQERSAQTVEVDLSNFKFSPATLNLRQGQRYRLHLVNRSSGGHDFVSKSFFANASVAPADAAKVKDGEVDLRGGAAVDVTLVPNAAGRYKVHCSHFMHAPLGMTGTILVS